MGYTYCISDIHGESEKYFQMLQTINFSDEDRLFVLGDVIDRKSSGITVLLDIMNRPNVHMLLGNHEQMCLDTFIPGGINPEAHELWRYNGGAQTYRELRYRLSASVRRKIIRFLSELPYSMTIEVGGREFCLVHGYPGNTKDECIWGRPKILSASNQIPKVKTIIGHTPTSFLTGEEQQPLKIWHGDNLIDIDCGCAMDSPYRRLACLRLNDMAEYYC